MIPDKTALERLRSRLFFENWIRKFIKIVWFKRLAC